MPTTHLPLAGIDPNAITAALAATHTRSAGGERPRLGERQRLAPRGDQQIGRVGEETQADDGQGGAARDTEQVGGHAGEGEQVDAGDGAHHGVGAQRVAE